MLRALSLLFAGLLVAAVFFLPEGDRLRLASLAMYRVLSEGEIEVQPEQALPPYLERYFEAEGLDRAQKHSIPIRKVLFASDAFRPTGETSAKFLLGGALIRDLETPSEDLTVHLGFREGLVRGLRQAAAKEGIEIEIVGDQMPAMQGLGFDLAVRRDLLQLSWNMPQGPSWTEQIPWNAPTRSSLLPPLVAIILALLLRRPVPALLVGVLCGAFLLQRSSGAGVLASTWNGGLDIVRKFLWSQMGDSTRLMIIAFVVAMLAMVGILTRNGGIRGIMNAVARLASTVRSTQFATYLMGLAVFFDDYANTILVGGTMRPLTDRLRIAREKLAYIVDSTAAPVAGISIFSTWIAFEVSTFSAQLPMAGLSPSDGYSVFLQTLPYRFYCIFSLVLVAIVTLSGRDFGPMLKAERRARTTGQLVREGGKPMVGELATTMEPVPGISIRAHRALVPLALFIGVTLFEIARVGGAFEMPAAQLLSLPGFTKVLNEGSGSWPLMIGSSVGLLAAILLSLQAGLRREIPDAALRTLRSMGIAIAILYLAWMLGQACAEVGTAEYLTVSLREMAYPMLLPMVLLLLSGAISFATGTSWGTMGILLPLVVGLSYQLGEQIQIGGVPGGMPLMILSIGAVLEGSIFGDHCSPISDTTVLSSVASASDHVDHVRTQAPYALLCLLVSGVAGYMPCAAFGLNPFLALAIGSCVLLVAMRLLGRRAEDPPEAARRFLA